MDNLTETDDGIRINYDGHILKIVLDKDQTIDNIESIKYSQPVYVMYGEVLRTGDPNSDLDISEQIYDGTFFIIIWGKEEYNLRSILVTITYKSGERTLHICTMHRVVYPDDILRLAKEDNKYVYKEERHYNSCFVDPNLLGDGKREIYCNEAIRRDDIVATIVREVRDDDEFKSEIIPSRYFYLRARHFSDDNLYYYVANS